MKKTYFFLLCFFLLLQGKAQIPNYVPSNGLVGWWPFNGNANDESGNGNHGTVSGATLTADRNGNANSAYSFNGSSNYISVSYSSSIGVQQNITISVWLYMNGGGCNPRILEINSIYNQCGGYTLMTNGTSNSNRNISTGFGNCTAGFGTTTSQSLSALQWHHLVHTVDAVNGLGKVYFDGMLVSTYAGNNFSGINYNSNPLTFGNINPGRCDWWGGNLDDIGIWNRALSQQEITALYNASAPCTFTSNFFTQDTLGACGPATTLTAPALYSYAWSTADTTQSINATASGWYSCQLTDSAGCTATDSVYVSLLNAQIQQNDTTVCAGTQIQLNLQIDGLNLTNNVNNWEQVSNINDSYTRIVKTNSGNYLCGAQLNSRLYSSSNMNNFLSYPSSLNTHNLAFGKANNGDLYFATGHDGIFKSTDNGISWSYNVAGGFGCGALDFATDSSGNLYTSVGGYLRGLYVSSNNGASWQNTFGGIDFQDIESVNYWNEVIITSGGNLWVTNNIGNTWTQITGQPFSNNTIMVKSKGPVIYVFTNNGTIYQSSDGGAIWTFKSQIPILSTLSNYLSDAIIRNNGEWFVAIDQNGVFRSIDNGINWTLFNQGYSGNTHFLYSDNIGLLLTTSQGIYRFKEALQFSWSTGDTTSSINVSPTQTTTYYCTVSNGITSCVDSVTVTVPTFGNIIAQDTLSACGSSLSVTAAAGYSSYLWSNGDNTANTTVTQSGWYSVAVSDGTCTATDSVYVSLLNAQIQQNDTTVCEGTNLTLSLASSSSASNACAPLPANLQNGLVGYWPFCGNANDESGNGNNGTVNGANLSVDRFGNIGKAYNFSCSSINTTINTTSITNQMTLSFWFMREGQGCIGPRVMEFSQGSNQPGELMIEENYPAGVRIGHVTTAGLSASIGWMNFPSNSNNIWNHYLYTNDGIHAKTYYNGQLANQYNTIGSPVLDGNAAFGWMNHPANDGIYGALDDIAIYNRALSAAEVNQLYAMGNAPTSTYLWSTGDTTSSINVGPTQTTTYYCTVSNGITSCVDSVTVTVPTFGNIIAQDTLSACGSSLSVTAAAGYSSYLWSNGDNTASTSVTQSGWYSVTVSDGTCTATDSVYVSLLNAQIQQNDTTVCAGTNLTLSLASSSSASNACAPLPANLQNGLVGYWPFCGNANDESGNGNNGTVNGATLTTDRFGNVNSAYSFNGNSINIPLTSQIQNTPVRTISCWYNANTSQIGGRIFETTFPNWGVAIYNSNIMDLWHCDGMNAYNAVGINAGVLNNWHQMVYTTNIISQTVDVYIDATNVYSGSTTLNGAPCPTNWQNQFIRLGLGLANESFFGKIDDILIYNRSLSASEVNQLYAIGNAPTSTYLWSNGDTTSSINVSPTQTTTYYCTVSNGITSCVDSVTVTVPTFGNIIAQDTLSACGSSLSVTAAAGYSSYLWSNGDNTASTTVTQSGWYSVAVSDGTCTATDSVYVSLLNAQIQQNDTTVCAGTNLTLSLASSSSASNACAPLPANLQNGLVGYWPFCGNANDESGNGNNGTVNGATLTTDRFGNVNSAYSFDGTIDFVDVPHSNSLICTNEITISLWLNANSINTGITQTTVSKGQQGNYWNYGVSIGATGDFFYNYTNYSIGPQSLLVANQWQHVVISINQILNSMHVYINGNDETPLYNSNTNSVVTNFQNIINSCCTANLNFGKNAGGQAYFGGKLDDIAIYNRALSAAEVNQLYAMGNAPTSTYLWSTGDTTSTINVSPSQTTTYYCTVSNGITSCVDSVTVTVSQPTIITNAAPASVCAGASTTLSATGATTYVWMPGSLSGAPSVTPSATTTYTVTGTDVNGCSNTATKTITVNPLPTIIASATPSSICVGASSTLSATGGISYSWMPGSLSGAPVVSPTTTTTYTVTGTDVNGCSNTATKTITVNPLPTIVASATPSSICVGASSTLSATGGTSYTWMPGNLSGAPVVSPTTTTTYTVTGTDINGCSNTTTKTIMVNPLPIIIASVTPSSICVGASSTLNATGGTSYTWMPGNLSGAPVVSPTTTTTYTVTGTSVNGCINTATKMITVNPLPTIIASATPSSICVGASSTLSATGGTSYSWMPGSLSGTPVVIPGASTTFTVTGTDVNGCSNTATKTITVNPLPTIIASATPSSICVGASSTLSATGGTSYSWMPGNLSGAPVVSPTTTTTYTVTGTDMNGCSNTTTKTITVNPLPTIVASATPSSICSGASSTLSATGGTSYTWMPGSLSGAPVVSPTTTTTYTVTGTDVNGCSNTATKTITVNPLPTIVASATPSSVCAGASSTLSATGATSYSWMPGNLSGAPVVIPGASTTFTVTGTDGNGCSNTTTKTITVNPLPTIIASATPSSICVGASSTLSATGGTSYTWMPGNLSGAPVVTPSTTTTYTVTGTSVNGCSNTATKTITVNPLPTIIASATPSSICVGASSTLSATGGTSYTWMPGNLSGAPVVSPTVTTTYTVTGTSVNGCSNTATKTITVNPLPIIIASATPSSICAGASSTLSATGGTSYSWIPGSLSGAPSVTPSATTTYTVTGTDVNGCSNTATKTITVNPLPTINASATPSSICSGASSTLSATGGTSYSWMPGNLSGAPVVSPTVTTTYTVTGTDMNGCSNTATKTITVNPLPIIIASATPSSICAGASSTLSATGGTSYSWIPGSLSGAPVVSPTTTTTYTVTGTDMNGCSNTTTKTITVNPLPIMIASATPSSICAGASSTLSATGGTSYSWMPGSLSGAPVVSPTTTTIYTVTGTDGNGCSNTTAQTITVNPLPTIVASATPSSICVGASSTLSATGGTSYSWMPGSLSGAPVVSPTTTTTYTVTGTDGNGCSNTTIQTIMVNDNPIATITPLGPTTFCSGGNVMLNANNGAGLTYQWYNGASAIGVTTSICTATQSGSYSVVVSNASGCSATSSPILVNVIPTPNPMINSAGNLLSVSGGPYTSYQWYLNGVAITGATNATYTFTQNGNYSVKVSKDGCEGESAMFIVKNVGIDDIDIQSAVLSPNPASGMVQIVGLVPYETRLTNSQGQVVMRVYEEKSFSVSHLASGIYYVQMYNKEGALIYRQKLIRE